MAKVTFKGLNPYLWQKSLLVSVRSICTIALALIVSVSLSACGGSDDEPDNRDDVEEDVSILIDAEMCEVGGRILSCEAQLIEIYEGADLEKRSAFDGVAYKKGTNTTVQPIISTSLSGCFGVTPGKKYLIAVVCKGLRYGFTNGAYSYKEITAPNVYKEYIKTFSANSRTNVYEDWDAETKYTPDCLNGKWGDSKEVIKAIETGTKSDEGMNFISYGYKYSTLTTYYFGDNGFNHGQKSKYYSVDAINGAATLLGYVSVVRDMINAYGQPTSYTQDILSLEPSSSEFKAIGEEVIKGKSITYIFNDGKVSAVIKGDAEYYKAYFGKASAWTITEDYRQ